MIASRPTADEDWEHVLQCEFDWTHRAHRIRIAQLRLLAPGAS
jgi:hypothetical protein